MDRLSPARRPGALVRAVGTQKWRSLLFVHWRVPLDALRPLVPSALQIDLFDGQAFVGLVAFEMHDIRPSRLLPPVPTARRFDELNLRTYVHVDGRDPGIWFFSLDASSALAVLGARALYHLPYYWARMESGALMRDGTLRYRSDRRWESDTPARFDAHYEVSELLDAPVDGSFEHFLVERYYLYARTDAGDLLRGQVHHAPYPLRKTRVLELQESIVAAAGLPPPSDRASELWSPGVDVEIFRLERVRA